MFHGRFSTLAALQTKVTAPADGDGAHVGRQLVAWSAYHGIWRTPIGGMLSVDAGPDNPPFYVLDAGSYDAPPSPYPTSLCNAESSTMIDEGHYA
jgi:hypothetical protein